jgi:ribosomal protein S18 acetylase RimI-like enzyme
MSEVVQITHKGMLQSRQLSGHLGSSSGPGFSYLLARLGGCEVGVLTFFETENGGACHLHELYVAPRWRRRGVGNALVTRALEMASERGYRRITLLARPMGRSVSRPMLKRWYECFGFNVTPGNLEEMQFYIAKCSE